MSLLVSYHELILSGPVSIESLAVARSVLSDLCGYQFSFQTIEFFLRPVLLVAVVIVVVVVMLLIAR